VNGEKVAEGRIENTVPFVFSADETEDVGEDLATPVTEDYKEGDNKFTGTIDKVTIADVGLFDDHARREGVIANLGGAGTGIETDLRLSEIAPRVGYRSEFSFSRAFKLARGLSPIQYRYATPSRSWRSQT
jgi:AraC-like DNA-binding protein